MAQATLNVRTSEDVEDVLGDFYQDDSPKFNATTLAAFAECEEIIKSGICRFKNSAEMFEALENDVDA